MPASETAAALYVAVAAGEKRHLVIEDIIENSADRVALLNSQNDAGQTPLIFAVMRDNFTAVTILVRSGADLGVTWRGETPLHLAVLRCPPGSPMIGYLVRSGAPRDLLNARGFSPLHLAAVRGDRTLIDTLVRLGCDASLLSQEVGGSRRTAAQLWNESRTAAQFQGDSLPQFATTLPVARASIEQEEVAEEGDRGGSYAERLVTSPSRSITVNDRDLLQWFSMFSSFHVVVHPSWHDDGAGRRRPDPDGPSHRTSTSVALAVRDVPRGSAEEVAATPGRCMKVAREEVIEALMREGDVGIDTTRERAEKLMVSVLGEASRTQPDVDFREFTAIWLRVASR